MHTSACANQKGGTGKTSTTVHLGYALARTGRRVLLVDMDPQASLTQYFIKDPTALEATVYTALIDHQEVKPLSIGEDLWLLPANIDLAAAEVRLPSKRNNERALARLLDHYAYDYCLVDCPPSLGILTVNALSAAERLLIPTATEIMSERTMPIILDLINEVRASQLNPSLTVWRILPTLFDSRLAHHKEILEVLRAKYGQLVYEEPVKSTTKYKDASGMRVDIRDLDFKLGEYWDRLAAMLMAESEREDAHQETR